MNIPAIMGLRLAIPNQEPQKQNNFSRFGLRMAAPLSKDTVCFKGTPKGADKAWEISGTAARAVRRRLEAVSKRVESFMEQNFGDLVATEKYPKNPIERYSVRLKSSQSIKEKTGSRKLVNTDEILTEMTDLVGAKLVFRDASKQKVDSVLDRFIPLMKSGKIELLEIENKRPMSVKELPEYKACEYDYASMDFLEKMIAIQNDIWKNGGNKQKVKKNLDNDFTKANYCATHFLFRLPGKNKVTFELQVVGNNVNEAKHIDDILYKKLDGKNSPDCTPEFDKIFEPFVNKKFFAGEPNAKELVENAKEKLNKYRGEVFLLQRRKEPLPYRKKRPAETFLPLSYNLFPPDIEIKYGISSTDFDYNNLSKLLQRSKKKSVAKKAAVSKTKKAEKS